jgi:hypothetical protein
MAGKTAKPAPKPRGPKPRLKGEDKERVKKAVLLAVSDGIPLAQVCRDVGIGLRTWYEWCDADAELSAQIARARKSGYDVIATDVLRIVDEQPPVTANGTSDSGYVAWQKNRAWARMQLLAKWDPKRYGDKLELSGDPDRPIALQKIERVIVDK